MIYKQRLILIILSLVMNVRCWHKILSCADGSRPVRLYKMELSSDFPIPRRDRECSVNLIGSHDPRYERSLKGSQFRYYAEMPHMSIKFKSKLLSIILLPDDPRLGELSAALPGDVFVFHPEFGPDQFSDFFSRYHFTLIRVPLSVQGYPPVLFLSALSYHTVPMTSEDLNWRYWIGISFKADKSVVKIGNDKFEILKLNKFLEQIERNFENFYSDRIVNIRILQNILIYRHGLPIETQIRDHACVLCSLPRVDQRVIVVGIMSARQNRDLRDVIRGTWLRILKKEKFVFVKFFVGTGESAIEHSNDLVELPIVDAYRNLTVKSLLMYQWVNYTFPTAVMFLRLDDDIYVRPAPVISQLISVPPVRYWWGLFAHLSYPIRDPMDAKMYNSIDAFPDFDAYPMYTRGVMFAISMDIIRMVLERLDSLNIEIHPDDTALGFWIYRMVADREITVSVNDSDENRFALNPNCDSPFSKIQSDINWAIHHVDPDNIRCMFESDINGGYYRRDDKNEIFVEIKKRNNFPNLCHCVKNCTKFENLEDFDSSYERFIP